MSRTAANRASSVDMSLLVVAGALLCIGLVMLTSASITTAERSTGNPFHYLEAQLMAVAVGLVVAGVISRIPIAMWEKLSLPLAGLALIMLVAVLVPGLGRTVNGSTRWLALGGVNLIQVSEPSRLFLMIFVAGYAVRRQTELQTTLMGFVKPIALIGLAAFLLLLEPDFGAAVVLLSVSMAMLFVAGARIRDVLLLTAPLVVAFAALAYSSPYRLRRITGFMDPWQDPFDSGFQLTNSLMAIGNGEWFGTGLGRGIQKLFYLPEAHTDFVFAVIAEEFGLVGSLVLIVLFGVLVWRILQVAKTAMAKGRLFAAYLAFGIGVWIGIQATVNIGVNMGILPTKGLTLPLISYGRSSILVTLIALGILLRIDMENRGAGSGSRRRG